MGKALLLFIVIISVAGCRHPKKLISIDPEFARYIEAYTSGTISKTSPIVIRLTDQMTVAHTVNEPLTEKLFSFDPSVSGTAVWTDERTLEFRPEKQLEPGKMYEVEFYLGKVIKVPDQFKTFRFNVQVLLPSFSVTSLGLKTDGDSREKMIYTGQVETADVEDTAAVQKLVSVSYNGKSLPLQWMHDMANRKHTFWVPGIVRTNAASEMKITWDGAPIHASEKGSESVMVPAIGDFKVLNVRAVNDPETYALVQFSAPIATSQDLTGLILLSPDPGLSYTVNGSEVKLFSDAPLDGSYDLTVNPGVEDIWGEKLANGYSGSVYFENRKPYVKILGKGEILPNSGKLTLPFEACNLKAVDVSVIRIYENNIPQFFQVNDMKGGEDLRRVGRPVVQKTIPLSGDPNIDLQRRNRFALDLDQLIRTEPGAMYRITIGFRPEYSVYTCIGDDSGEQGTGEGDEYYDEYEYYGYYNQWSDEDDSFWSRYDDYYPYGYDWEQRENPCHPSYYNKEKWESRNILASNIGLTVKRGNDNGMTVLVTNLLTADPMSGVQLEVLDYQQQVICTATSDASGMARFETKRKPFLLVAKHNKERGYLKLDDGSSLLMSRFDVEGEDVQDGIKGFLFGERGVWRPGDSIYMSFILEDKSNLIPEDHPVEFQLITPKGQVYRKMMTNAGLNGYYVFRTATDPSAPTGNWTAKVTVGGAKFEKRVKIETIMPNRLKINLDFGSRKLLGMTGDDNVSLTSQWLFGAPARNLRAKVDMTLTAQSTAFDKYKDYEFNDPGASYETQLQTVFDGKLNDEGHTDFNLLVENTEGAPGLLKASFTVKVFEPGGAYSIDHVSMPYSPFESYVGLRVPKGEEPFNYLVTGKNYSVDIVNVNGQGIKINSAGEVDAELYKVEWKWWWDNSDNSVTNYSSSPYSKLIKSAKVKLTNGSGKWTVAAPEDGWGRYLLVVHDPVSGHSAGKVVYFDDPYWQTRSHGDDDATTATMLSFSSDKPKYSVGEKVKLSVPSSKDGRMFISIENGRKVLKTYWIKTEAGQTQFEFSTDAEMAPNVYVHISLFQPHAQTVNDMPIRMYGVIPVLVEDKNTVLKPVIQMADVLRPEQPSSLTVSEETGRDMTYTIAIVDEGLLDLTRYKTPDPHSYFYSREALGVRTWDLYDHVIGAYGGQLERILTIGGDEDLYGLGKQHGANRFKPVVKFMGPFYLKKGQRQTHQFQLPQYIGSVRVMVVAEQNAAYGNAEKTVAVKNPLMMLATLPRVIGPTEQIKIPVTVFASEKHVKNVSVQLNSNPMLEIIGDSRKSITFSGIGEQTVYFDARVKSTTGTTKVKLQSASGNEKAVSEVEIQVRNPNPPITRIDMQNIEGNGQWQINAAPIGVPNNSQCVLELSSSPPMNLQKRLNYLVQYPHGCIEQTTSAVFPQLVLGDLMDLSEPRKKEIQNNINHGIRKIINFQTVDGGFSYWPGNRQADDWGTSYAGHFLLEAKARGYSVPDDVLKSWLRYQRARANQWSPTLETIRWYGGDLAQAYRLYLLALAKMPELGAMNRLKEFSYLSPEGKWRLAAAYKLAGYDQVAAALVKDLPTSFTPVTYWGITYGSRLRDQAMALETMVLLGRRQQAAGIVMGIAAQMATDEWYSTQTTAYCLLAIAKYNGAYQSDKRINATVTIHGKTTTVTSGSVLTQVPVDVTKGSYPLTVVNKGGAVLYARLITTGQPLPGENVPTPVGNNRLRIAMEFLTQGGEPLKVDQLTQGTDFVAKVTVNNPGGFGTYTELALSQIFPSGWEIMNTRIWDEDSPFRSSTFDYQDIRDDRVYTYFDLGEKESRTYYVMLNAAYMGKYYLPMLNCEAMYDRGISASTSGKWIEVVQ